MAEASIHPFKPAIPKTATKLLIGTLPPDGAHFYFSNSPNTRLWDILSAIKDGSSTLEKGGYKKSKDEKLNILENLNLGISDIILNYERAAYASTNDTDIIPKKYNDLVKLAISFRITELLFVYENALKWFSHSLKENQPVPVKELKEKYQLGEQEKIIHNGIEIKCILLPSPLNRGRKNETLQFKLEEYRKYIRNK